MAELKARRILGGSFTAEDTLELQFTYTGDLRSNVNYLEIVSGPTVTHGGGAAAATRLHYKAHSRDDGSTDEVDGIIDYASSTMAVVQSEKGTSVIKVVGEYLLKSDYDAWKAEYDTWSDAYVISPAGEDMQITEGAPAMPEYPDLTVIKSGELTLEWLDDSFA